MGEERMADARQAIRKLSQRIQEGALSASGAGVFFAPTRLAPVGGAMKPPSAGPLECPLCGAQMVWALGGFGLFGWRCSRRKCAGARMTSGQGGAGADKGYRAKSYTVYVCTDPDCHMRDEVYDPGTGGCGGVPAHGTREYGLLTAITVIPDPTPELAKRHPDIDWTQGVVEGVRHLISKQAAETTGMLFDERAHADSLAEALGRAQPYVEASERDYAKRLHAEMADALVEHKRRRNDKGRGPG